MVYGPVAPPLSMDTCDGNWPQHSPHDAKRVPNIITRDLASTANGFVREGHETSPIPVTITERLPDVVPFFLEGQE